MCCQIWLYLCLQVLAMLVDLQLAAVTTRRLGSHAAHMTWQQVVASPVLSAMPGVPITLQQVSRQKGVVKGRYW
jgi:hypothetical protein